MRLLCCFTLCGLISACSDSLTAAEPDLIFLLIGQSNMAGRAPLAEEDKLPLAGVMLLNAEGEWEGAINPLNRYATDRKVLSMQRLGPGDGFARTLHSASPKKTIGLLVNARGGSNIDLWKPGQHLYDHTLHRINKLKKKPTFAGVIWHQGEANSDDPDYLNKLVQLVKDLRRDLEQPELPFIVGEVFKDLPVNDRMAKLPAKLEQTAVVKATDLAVFDGVHFDRESQKTLGARYANAWLKLTKIFPR